MSSESEFPMPQIPAQDMASSGYVPLGPAQAQAAPQPQFAQQQPQFAQQQPQVASQFYGATQAQAGPQSQLIVPKNPALGVILSFFIPGLGSIVNGSTGRGVTILVVYAVGWILSLILIGIPILIGAWIWGLVDGYLSAQRWNQAHGIVS